jgi:hypothetical protein
MRSLLGLIVTKLVESERLSSMVNSLKIAATCNDTGQVALQWWVFVSTNFSSISKSINMFDAAAQQWDVHGVVYRELFGGGGVGLSGIESVDTKNVHVDTRPDAELQISASTSAVAYNRNPLRHSFPNVSYNQRSRFSFDRGPSRVSVIRYVQLAANSTELTCCVHRVHQA